MSSPSGTTERVSTKQTDYLTSDPKIPGQKFAVMSFVSPEDVLRSRDAFEFREYLGHVAADVASMLESIAAKFGGDAQVQEMVGLLRERHAYLWSAEELQRQFDAFRGAKADDLLSAFQEKHGFQTCVRGFKVRGAYDSLQEARFRAEELHKRDPHHNAYVCAVGSWCPWSPNPDDLNDSEYAETELNTLMKAYKEKTTDSILQYEERKADKIAAARASTTAIEGDGDGGGASDSSPPVGVEELTAQLEQNSIGPNDPPPPPPDA